MPMRRQHIHGSANQDRYLIQYAGWYPVWYVHGIIWHMSDIKPFQTSPTTFNAYSTAKYTFHPWQQVSMDWQQVPWLDTMENGILVWYVHGIP